MFFNHAYRSPRVSAKSLSSLNRRPGRTDHPSRPALSSPPRRYPLDRLIERAVERGATLNDLELAVGNVLFHNEGRHLDDRRVRAILAAGGLDVSPRLARQALDALADRGIVQPIDVGDGLRFYDTDLRPHPHVWDPATGELRDADRSVVLLA